MNKGDMAFTIHRFGGLAYAEEVLGPAEEELKASWREEARLITRRFKKVREGTRLQNIRSKRIGIALHVIPPSDPHVEVMTQQGNKKRRVVWSLENVRFPKKRKRKKKK